MQFLFAPLLEAGGFARVAVDFRTAHEDLGARDERSDKADHAAHDGDVRGDAHAERRMKAAALYLDVALGVAHRRRVTRLSAHHHPFEHRLPADGTAARLFLFFLFFLVFAHILRVSRCGDAAAQ